MWSPICWSTSRGFGFSTLKACINKTLHGPGVPFDLKVTLREEGEARGVITPVFQTLQAV
jgi:hypothetical protein